MEDMMDDARRSGRSTRTLLTTLLNASRAAAGSTVVHVSNSEQFAKYSLDRMGDLLTALDIPFELRDHSRAFVLQLKQGEVMVQFMGLDRYERTKRGMGWEPHFDHFAHG